MLGCVCVRWEGGERWRWVGGGGNGGALAAGGVVGLLRRALPTQGHLSSSRASGAAAPAAEAARAERSRIPDSVRQIHFAVMHIDIAFQTREPASAPLSDLLWFDFLRRC